MKKTIFRILKLLVFLLLLIGVVGFFFMRSAWGQSRLASYVLGGMSKDLNTVMTIESVDIDLFKTLVLKGVYIEDLDGDTLAYIGKLAGDVKEFSNANRTVKFNEVKLTDTYFNLYKKENSDGQNIQFLIDYFKKEDTGKQKQSWTVDCDALVLENSQFKRNNYNDPPKTDRVDFAHMHIYDINGRFTGIDIGEADVTFDVEDLSLKMKKGFEVERIAGRAEIRIDQMDFQEMALLTENTTLDFDFLMKYKDIDDFEDFVDKIWLKANFRESDLHLQDLAYFAPQYAGMNKKVRFQGVARGETNNLKTKDVRLDFGRHSVFKGDVSLSGLPNIESTFIHLDVHRFISSMSELSQLPIPNIQNQVSSIPERFNSIGHFVVEGEFTGFVNDFVVRGVMDSELGDLVTDIALVQSDAARPNSIQGSVTTTGFNLGQLVGEEKLNSLSADLNISAQGPYWNELSANIDGLVTSIDYLGFTYKMLDVDGQLEKNLFNGELSINQPEVSLDFKGVVDFRESRPKFDFKADLYEADLSSLGFTTSRDSTSLTGKFDAKFTGDDADNFEGRFDVMGLSYCEGSKEFYFEDFNVLSKRVNSERFLSLRSSQIDMDVQGFFKLKEIEDDLLYVFQDVMPALYEEKPMREGSSVIHVTANLKETALITEIFLPEWTIGAGTTFEADLDMPRRYLNVESKTDTLEYRGVLIRGVNLDIEKNGGLAYIAIENDLLQWEDSIRFKDNYFTLFGQNNKVESDITWSILDYNSSGSFSVVGDMTGPDEGTFKLNPSQIVISDNYWMTTSATPISFDGEKLLIDSLEITNGVERIFGSGEISADPESEFVFEVEEFELEHLNKFLPNPLFTLDGTANVSGVAKDVLNTFSIESDLTVDDLELGGEEMGDLRLSSAWSTGKSSLNILGGLAKDAHESVTFEGNYYPKSDTDRLDATLNFDDFDLHLLNRLNTTAFSGIGGTADGQLVVKGDFLNPDISGDLLFKAATIHFNYLNTTYTFSNAVIIEKDWMGFDQIPFTDEFGNMGYANGTVIHENYKDWNYDISAEFDELMVMNTSEKDNSLYHGTIFATGSVSVSGYQENVDIEVNGKTDPGTTFELPLGGSAEVQLENFVTFIDPDAEEEEKNIDLTGVNLNMNVEITTDAKMKIIFDEQIGDVIEGRGNGNLSMSYNQQGDLDIYGRIVVSQGDYLFTLQNVIAKGFTLRPGGTIDFFGSPYRAELNLSTIYNVRTSLYDIMYENPEAYRRRVPVEVEMGLSGPLLNPDIKFGIELPTVAPDVKTIVESRISSDQELNKQVFALLVLNKFLPPESARSETAGSSVVTSTGSEFVSSQLSNWFSQISQDVDIGVNYRPGDNITSEEWAVALSTQLFNDRLLLSGNVGVQSASNSSSVDNTASSIIGDFTLEYMITQDGRLRLKVFNENNDNDFLNYDQSNNTQGIGLIFQKEFDGLFDDRKPYAKPL